MMRIACVVASLGACSGKAPLPELDTVLDKANSKAIDFAEQALAMQRRLNDQQEKSRQALAADRKTYEDRLGEVAHLSETIKARNAALKAGNRILEGKNEAKVADLKRLQAKAAEMRHTLQGITDKVSAAQLFLESSLVVTDDSKAEELAVLAPTTPRPTLDRFLAATKHGQVSLLSIRAMQQQHDGAEDPEEIVDALSKSLSEIAAAEAQGADDLKASFEANLLQLQEHQEILNATEARLLGDQSALKEDQRKLSEAEAHLKATDSQLRKRLEGMRVFASTVGDEASGRKDTASSTKSTKSANTTVAANGTQAATKKTALSSQASQNNITKGAMLIKRFISVAKPMEGTTPALASVVKKAQAAVASIGDMNAPVWKNWLSTLR